MSLRAIAQASVALAGRIKQLDRYYLRGTSRRPRRNSDRYYAELKRDIAGARAAQAELDAVLRAAAASPKDEPLVRLGPGGAFTQDLHDQDLHLIPRKGRP